MIAFLKNIIFLGLTLFVTTNIFAEDSSETAKAFQILDEKLTKLVTEKQIVGGQVTVSLNGKILFSKGYGTVAIGSKKKVNNNTLFLIGSCSKPFASICMLSLIGDKNVPIELNDKIDRWLPKFAEMNVKGKDTAKRAPTIAELLSHSSGLYSQKIGMTKAQTRLIRSFDLSLDEAVKGISSFELIAQPGNEYAYSGAGYCVAGRVAELAAKKPFEDLLQQRLCKPLGLSRTTFFPAKKFPNNEIATGARRKLAPHLLGDKHRFPLIGGSIYSTAEEMTKFEQGVLDQWKARGKILHISPKLLQKIGQSRKPNPRYNLGWAVRKQKGKLPRLSHGGSLQSYRAYLSIDLESNVSVAGCWTLPNSKTKIPIRDFLNRVMNSLSTTAGTIK